MRRTQIYIDEEIYGSLKRESKMKGISISEIIRDSLEKKISSRVEKIIRATDSVSGLWKNRRLDVEEFIRTTRKDRNICS